MKVLMIAGLGNPGEEYYLTRHNAGADYVSQLCHKNALPLKKEKQINGSYAEVSTEQYRLIFIIPSTYMNESGLCISKSKKFFKKNFYISFRFFHITYDRVNNKIYRY